MHEAPSCPDCGVPMQEGFVPDFYWGPNKAQQTVWHSGTAHVKTYWGGFVRTDDVHIDRAAALPVTAYRCPRCGFLKSYARSSGP